jgi:hypothetical protein
VVVERRAALIGAQTGGLLGVGTDLDAMSAVLSARGFQVRRAEGESATRDGILAAYRGLIRDTAAGDAAVVYFSMHGGIAEQTTEEGAGADERPARYQFVVPFDFEASAEGDFRGITALELSALQDELTAKTTNVTVILDCCYASRMSRDLDLLPKALPRVQYADIAAHLARVGGSDLSGRRRDPVGNQSAVRLVAAGPDESAFEYSPHGAGTRAGVFTEALRKALTEAGDLPVSWSMVLREVRRRVQLLSPFQRPEAEGPSHRLLFRTEVAAAAAVPVLVDGPRVTLGGGRITDIDVGDVFAVMPAGSAAADPAGQVAVATVTGVAAARADVRLEWCNGATGVPAGAVAFPVGRANRRFPVAVAGDGPAADAVRERVHAASHVRGMEPGDAEPLATVQITGNTVTVRDRSGELTVTDPAGRLDPDGVVAAMNRLARAAALRLLESGQGPDALTDPFEVQVGTVVAGTPRPLLADAAVAVDQRVFLRLSNHGPNRLYFFVFDVGVAGRVTLVTNTDPSGIALDPGAEWVVGRDEQGALTGLPLRWPSSVPATGPRPETLLVIVTSRPQDLGGLQQDGVTASRGPGRSGLERLLDQVAGGGRRDLSPAPAAMVRYAVHRTDLLLHPYPLPGPEPRSFLLDERPDPSMLLTPRGGPRPPREVAVRIGQVLVHRNRAWGNADIRLDTLVITGGVGKGAPPTYCAHTEQFTRVRDTDRLSLDRLLIFHGPVRDYLDIAVWVTRNRANTLRLSQLLKENVNSPDLQQALTTTIGLAGAMPQAAVAAATIGATATIVDVAYRLLSAAVGDSIGVYRNSLLAQDRFGVGPHPPTGTLRAQDFSFSYEIIDVGGAR